MEKIKKDKKRIKIPFVKIYKNDIKEIIEILEEEKDFVRHIEITGGGFNLKFEEIERLKEELGVSRMKELEIKAYVPDEHCSIDISFNKHNGVDLYCYKMEDNKIFGIVKKIENILIKKQRIFGKLASNYLIFGLLGVSTFSMPVLLYFFVSLQEKKYLFFLLIATLFFLLLFYIALFYKNIIYLKDKKELSNFFIRNKDVIILNIISAVSGAILGAIIMSLFQQCV